MSRCPRLFLLLLSLSSACALHGQPAPSGDGNADRAAAVRTALEVVARQAGVDGLTESDVSVLHVARINWPNSALGCPKPGQSYLQVITPGFVVLVEYRGKTYRVHTAGNRGLICTLNRMATPARLLPYLELMARKDLVEKLGLKPAALDSITIVEAEPATWTGRNLGCGRPASAGEDARRVEGFKLTLKYQGREFEYRTTGTRVMPCPAIEVR